MITHISTLIKRIKKYDLIIVFQGVSEKSSSDTKADSVLTKSNPMSNPIKRFGLENQNKYTRYIEILLKSVYRMNISLLD